MALMGGEADPAVAIILQGSPHCLLSTGASRKAVS